MNPCCVLCATLNFTDVLNIFHCIFSPASKAHSCRVHLVPCHSVVFKHQREAMHMSHGFNPFIVAMPGRQERREAARKADAESSQAAAGNSSQSAHDELIDSAAKQDQEALRAHLQKTTPEQDYAALRTALQKLLADMTRYMRDMHQFSDRYTEARNEFQKAHDERFTKSTELQQKMHEATENLNTDPSTEDILDAALKVKEVSLAIIQDLLKPFVKHSEDFFTHSIGFHTTYDRMRPLLELWHDNIGNFAHYIDKYLKYHEEKLQDQVDFGLEQLQRANTQHNEETTALRKNFDALQKNFDRLKSMYAFLIKKDPQNKKIDALKDENNNRKTTIVKMGMNYMKMHRDLQDLIQNIQNPEDKVLYERKAAHYAAQIAKFPDKWLEENTELKQLSETWLNHNMDELDQALQDLSTHAADADDDLEAGSKEILQLH